MSRLVWCLFLCTGLLTFVSATPGKAAVLEKQADGVVVPIHDGFLALQVRADNIFA
jgi:hypothetical protein